MLLNFDFSVNGIILFLAFITAAALIISAHEFAHAFAAVKNGDITPKLYKRYTLNPIAHFDPIGIVMMAFVGFGWAKPVPVNPSNFRNYRKGSFFVSIAGVATNFALSFLFYPLLILAAYHLPDILLFDDFLIYFLLAMFQLNLVFCVFNLLPLYPLDGFRLFESLNRTRGPIYRFLRNYGQYVLLGLILLSFVTTNIGLGRFDILRIVLNFIITKIGAPITFFWGLIL